MSRITRTCLALLCGALISTCLSVPREALAQDLLAPPEECVPPGPGLVPIALPFKIDGTPISATGYTDWFAPSGGAAIFLGCDQASVNPSFFPALFGRDSTAVSTTTDLDVFSGTSNKNDDFIGSGQSPWAIDDGSTPQKDDLTEVFVNVSQDACFNFWLNGLVAYRSTDGDKHFDVEVNVAGLTRTATQIIGNGPENGRTAGADFIVTVDYVNGGAEACVEFRVWDGDSYEIVTLPIPPADPITGCDSLMFSAVNQDTVYNLPCPVVEESSQLSYVNLYEPHQMAEFAVNLSQLIPGFNASQYCRDSATVLVKTRSSASFTAELKDLYLARFNIIQPPPCAISGPSSVCEGSSAQFCETAGPENSHVWTVVSNPPGIASFAPGDSSCKTITFTGAGVCTVRVATTTPDTCTSHCETVVTVTAGASVAAGPDQSLCQTVPGPTAFTMAGTASGGTATWSVIGQTGTASGSIVTPGSLTTGVNVSGIGTVTLQLFVDASAPCPDKADTVVLAVTERATAGAGPDQNLCQLVPGPTVFTMAGTASGGTPSWSVIGQTGTASGSIVTPGSLTTDVNVTGIGTVTLRLLVDAALPCPDVADTVVVTVTERATVAAGPDQSLCQTIPGPTVFAMAGTATGGPFTWSIIGQTGTASGSIVTPGSLATNVNVTGIGTVTIRLAVDAAAPCPDIADTLVLTVTEAAAANAGPDQNLCQLVPGPTVFAMAGTASGGTPSWSVIGQTGTASGSIVTPGSLTTDVNVTGIGTVTLRLFVDAPAPCPDVADTVVVTVTERATVAAGPDQSLCQTIPGPTVFAMAGTASGGTPSWSVIGQTGTASGSIVTPGSLTTDVNVTGIGTVTLRLFVDAPAPCPDVADTVVVTVTERATVAAGPDQSLCQTIPGPTVFAMAGTATGGPFTWSIIGQTGSAVGSIVTPGSLTTNVNVTGIGTVTIRLAVDAAAPCPDIADTLVLTVTEAAAANAGPDQNLCQLVPGPTVFAMAGTATGGTPTWSIIGQTGSAVGAIVTPGSLTTNVNVTGIGTVTLRLFVDAPAPCPDVADTVVVTVTERATVAAGPDQALCEATPGPTVFAMAGAATGGPFTWSIIGQTGSAVGSIVTPGSLATNVNVTGIGTVTIRLAVDAAAPCPDIADTLVLTVNDKPSCTLTAPEPPLCASEGNQICVDEVPGATYEWKLISADAGWQIEGGANTRCLTYQAGNGGTTAIARVIITSSANCVDSCQVELTCVSKAGAFCTLTQGGWGNDNGSLNGERRWETVNRLITAGDPLVIGIKKSVNAASFGSISFTDGNEACVFQLMPGGGTPRPFVSNLGDVFPTLGNSCSVSPQTINSQGRFDNVFIGQVVALSLNARLSEHLPSMELCEVMVSGRALPGPDQILGTADDICTDESPKTIYISSRVLASLESLGLPKTVAGLIELCNRGLSGLPTGTATAKDLSGAAGAINEGFDECRCLIKCSDAGDEAQASGGAMQDGQQTSLPLAFGLGRAVPNPFGRVTTITLALPERSNVELSVYNVLGQRVASLQSGEMAAGFQSVVWTPSPGLPAGMYFVRMHAVGLATRTSFSATHRMVIVR